MLFLTFMRASYSRHCENPRCEQPIKENSIFAIGKDTEQIPEIYFLCGICGDDLEAIRDSINQNKRLDHEKLITLIQEASQSGDAGRKEQAEIDNGEEQDQ